MTAGAITAAGPSVAAHAERACDACLARGWLLGRLSGHLDPVRAHIDELLALGDDELIDAVGGRHACDLHRERWALDPAAERTRAADAGVEPVCRQDPDYPQRLKDLPNPPTVLYVAGDARRLGELTSGEPVAIVGARRATPYGRDMARSLAGGLAAAGLTVISGMAHGIDSAAHAGALGPDGPSTAALPGIPTVAVLPGGAELPYPAMASRLHARILAGGVAISELPPGTKPRRWSYRARNRITAALAVATILVEAGEQSGALLTAAVARTLGRGVGAVPGRVGTAQACGPNGLLAGGARVIRDTQDVLDLVYGVGARTAAAAQRARLEPELQRLFDAIAGGHDTPAALTRAGFPPERCLVAAAELELAGYITRHPGGRYAVIN